MTGNTAYDNTSGGIWAAGGSTVRGNSAYSNDETGIKTGGACTVRGNTVTDNGGVGLELGGVSGYAENVLANNDTNITGGGALGTNLCDGVSCNTPPRRRFYRTRFGVSGAGADEPNVCADGFHFASLWEIWAPSGLEYDTSLGRVQDDSGSGPPTGYGWVRTGHSAAIEWVPGSANCSTWTSAASGDRGTIAQLAPDWDGSSDFPSNVLPWTAHDTQCNLVAAVWCVQD